VSIAAIKGAGAKAISDAVRHLTDQGADGMIVIVPHDGTLQVLEDLNLDLPVIVVGGMGSLAGAFVAALLIGLLESFGKVSDVSGLRLLSALGLDLASDAALYPVLKLTVSQVAPVLPYLLLVVILIVRPKGLLGTRED
jgi:branched-subunit amino acid ABC-type transport system permease component